MGNDATKKAIDDGKIVVSFYEPKSLILQNTIDDLNNAKQFAEAIADIIPAFNEEGAETKRSKFIYMLVKERTNIDWKIFENILTEVGISVIGDDLEMKIREIIREYTENTKEEQYGDENGDGITTSDDSFTPEEEDLLNSPDEDFE